MNDSLSTIVGHWASWIGLPDEAVASLMAASAEQPIERLEAYQAALSSRQRLPEGSAPISAAIATLMAIPSMLERHRLQGITDDMSVATAADIALWISDHHRRHGTWGLSEADWIRHHIAGKLFRIGRLQFMLATCELPLSANDPLTPGDPIIEVHIPAGEPLDPKDCESSLEAARLHFAQDSWHGFTCISWLLARNLSEVLPLNSNILSFQRLFRPLPCSMDDRQTIERVFGCWPLNINEAPRNTGLQRAILDFYARGFRLDGGAGFIPRRSLPP